MAVFGGTELARGVLAWTTSTAPAQSPPVHMHGRFNVTLSGSATGVVADADAPWPDPPGLAPVARRIAEALVSM